MKRDDTADVLNDLIETSKNGEFSFRTAAEYEGVKRNHMQVRTLRNQLCAEGTAGH